MDLTNISALVTLFLILINIITSLCHSSSHESESYALENNYISKQRHCFGCTPSHFLPKRRSYTACLTMFSGIHSLFFGKKHQHRSRNQTVDDSVADITHSVDNDMVVIERRHSDDPVVKPGLYPQIDPGFPPASNLPYGISPSLSDIRPDNTSKKSIEGATVDLLHGVPFELASYIHIMTNEKDEKFAKFLQRTKDILTEGVMADDYSYDFKLEQQILNGFDT